MASGLPGITALALLLSASLASGQSVDGNGVPYRPWDLAVGGSLHVDSEMNAGSDDGWRGGAGVHVDIGRYWTSHLKTEGSFAAFSSHMVYGADQVPVPGGVANAFYRTRVRRTAASGAVTYQLFDNAFAHPYLSVGVRVMVDGLDKRRDGSALASGRTPVTYPIPPLETHEIAMAARPFVAAGFKSYLTERTFIRSELATAFNGRGTSQVTVRLGFGVDW